MVAKYYVAIRPQTNDFHAVHKEGCPFLHDDNGKIYLGLFKSGHEAIRKSRLSFTRTENCLFCCKESKIDRDKASERECPELDKVPGRLNMPLLYQQGKYCCLN